jgi:hypothetical protein
MDASETAKASTRLAQTVEIFDRLGGLYDVYNSAATLGAEFNDSGC